MRIDKERGNMKEPQAEVSTLHYYHYLRQKGYRHIVDLDMTSSAGDWTFLCSKNGRNWHMMTQENNWPGRGFTRLIDKRWDFGCLFCGSKDEAIAAAVFNADPYA